MRHSIDWSEFLKNGRGKESADRLLLLLSFLPATIIAAKICTVEALGVYLAAYGALAANNKWVDRNAVVDDSQMVETTSDSSSYNVSVGTRVSPSKQRLQEGTTGKQGKGSK